MSGKIVFKITDYIEPDLNYETSECEKLGVDFHHYQMKEASANELIEKTADADVILVNMAKFNREVISGLNKTQLIIRHGIGYDNLDVAAATERGIVCANEPTASSEDVAEQAIMLILSVYRKLKIQFNIFDRLVEERRLIMDDIYPVFRMGGKTLGIVGCGNIGSHVLRKMRSFGMNILVCDPYLSKERLSSLGIEHTPFNEVLAKSDIVTVHVPVTPETTNMFWAPQFEIMKKTSILINTSRAKIVHTHDLAVALKNKTIAGAGIDVHATEPPPKDYELLGMDNVLLTPHLAWYSEEGGWDIRGMIIDDLGAFTRGRLPKSVLNPEVLESPKLRMRLS